MRSELHFRNTNKPWFFFFPNKGGKKHQLNSRHWKLSSLQRSACFTWTRGGKGRKTRFQSLKPFPKGVQVAVCALLIPTRNDDRSISTRLLAGESFAIFSRINTMSRLDSEATTRAHFYMCTQPLLIQIKHWHEDANGGLRCR